MTEGNGIRSAMESLKATTEALAAASKATFATQAIEAAAVKAALTRRAIEAEAVRALSARRAFEAGAVAAASKAMFARPAIDVKRLAKPLLDINAERLKAVGESLNGIARLVESRTPDFSYERNFWDFGFDPVTLPPIRNVIDDLKQENAERQQEVVDLRRRVNALEMKGTFPEDADFRH